MPEENLLVEIYPIHWNGRRHSEHNVIQGCTVLPFRKTAVPVQ